MRSGSHTRHRKNRKTVIKGRGMYKIFNHFTPRVATLLLLFEVSIFVSATYLAASLRFGETPHEFVERIPNFGISALVYALLTSLSLAGLGVYELHSRQSLRASILRLAPAFLIGACLTVAAFYIFPDLYLGRGVLGLAFVLSLLAILLLRLIVFHLFRARFLKSRVLFLGASQEARECMEMSGDNAFAERFEVVGILPLQSDQNSIAGAFLLPNQGSLMSIARKYDVNEIVISLKNWRGLNVPIQQLLECKINGILITPIARFFEREVNQIQIDYLQPSALVFGDGFRENMLRAMAKRVVDLLAATTLLLVTLPMMLLAALAILIEDGAPVLYRQERVGKRGKSFMVLKFRSMRKDAEAAGVPTWAQAGDQRVTRVGAFMRKTRIDELPQIFNVLRGEMSFVGPRPERPYFVHQLSQQVPYYDIRHSIKPGITGFAQVRYRYGATVEDSIQKLQYDLYYIKNQSLFLDLLIIIDTVQVVLFAKGSR